MLLSVGSHSVIVHCFVYLFKSQACAGQLKTATPEEVSCIKCGP